MTATQARPGLSIGVHPTVLAAVRVGAVSMVPETRAADLGADGH